MCVGQFSSELLAFYTDYVCRIKCMPDAALSISNVSKYYIDNNNSNYDEYDSQDKTNKWHLELLVIYYYNQITKNNVFFGLSEGN